MRALHIFIAIAITCSAHRADASAQPRERHLELRAVGGAERAAEALGIEATEALPHLVLRLEELVVGGEEALGGAAAAALRAGLLDGRVRSFKRAQVRLAFVDQDADAL